MPPPNDDPDRLAGDTNLARESNGQLSISGKLAALLAESREDYRWPQHGTPQASQQTALDLESEVGELVRHLNSETAHRIVSRVSDWAGNQGPAQAAIEHVGADVRQAMANAVGQLRAGQADTALRALCDLPGIDLVIATKIYRFCVPGSAAALDRHTSYFFNSLSVQLADGLAEPATHFRREWADGRHGRSRLASFTQAGRGHNCGEYLTNYLPLLAGVAEALNHAGCHYRCAATGEMKAWRPADVDMASFFWWSQHGAR